MSKKMSKGRTTTIRIDDETRERLKGFRVAAPLYFESYNEVIKTLLDIAEALDKSGKLDNYIE